MTNREWLNGLSDKELAEFITSFGQECVCCPLDKTCDGACVIRIADWLSEPHETTGHEDLVNAGWMWSCEEHNMVEYTAGDGWLVRIRPTRMAIKVPGNWVTSDLWEPMCKYADKIRKERGWV